MDWAEPELSQSDRQHLARVAGATIDALTDSWRSIHGSPEVARDDVHALGWMDSEAYLALAKRSLRRKVLAPLRAHGIDPPCALLHGV
ncbi:hypothetical protein ACMHYB_22625 [Sorangium sp. So ce1128]